MSDGCPPEATSSTDVATHKGLMEWFRDNATIDHVYAYLDSDEVDDPEDWDEFFEKLRDAKIIVKWGR